MMRIRPNESVTTQSSLGDLVLNFKNGKCKSMPILVRVHNKKHSKMIKKTRSSDYLLDAARDKNKRLKLLLRLTHLLIYGMPQLLKKIAKQILQATNSRTLRNKKRSPPAMRHRRCVTSKSATIYHRRRQYGKQTDLSRKSRWPGRSWKGSGSSFVVCRWGRSIIKLDWFGGGEKMRERY